MVAGAACASKRERENGVRGRERANLGRGRERKVRRVKVRVLWRKKKEKKRIFLNHGLIIICY